MMTERNPNSRSNISRRTLIAGAVGGAMTAAAYQATGAAPIPAIPDIAQRNQDAGKSLAYAYHYVTKSVDPHASGDNPNMVGVRQMYEGLVDYAPGSFEVEGVLATDWSISDDGLTYTFTLRDGVLFHDGTTFDSAAVKRSYERLFALGLNPAVTVKDRVAAIETPDPQTVAVTLTEPFAPILMTLFNTFIVSPASLDANEGGDQAQSWLSDNSAGTGPYRLDSWERDATLTMVQFPEYWGGWERTDHIDRVEIRYITEPVTQTQLVMQGEVDLASSVPIDDLAALASNPDLWVINETGIVEYLIRLDNTRAPLDDLNFRKAIATVFDYPSTIADLLQGYGAIPQGYVPFRYASHNPEVGEELFDVEAAMGYLAESAYPQGASFTCTYIENVEVQRVTSEFWQAMLASIGIDLQLNPQPWATMVERSTSSETRDNCGWFAFNYGQKDETFAQWSTLSSSSSSAWGNYGYTNPDVDALLDEALMTPDDAARTDLLRQAQQVARDDVATVNTMINNDKLVGRQRVSTSYYDPSSPLIPLFYLYGIA